MALKQARAPGPPAWLDDNRVALADRERRRTRRRSWSTPPAGKSRRDRRANGAWRPPPTGASIATSAGPARRSSCARRRVGSPTTGRRSAPSRCPRASSKRSALALDATGRRLAIVWLREDGTTQCDVHDGDGRMAARAEPRWGAAAWSPGSASERDADARPGIRRSGRAPRRRRSRPAPPRAA